MKRSMTCLLSVVVAAAFATTTLASRSTLEQQKKRQFCSRTADLGRRACFADIAEEFYRAQAICLNHLDGAEGKACRQSFRETRAKLREECSAIHESRVDVCDLLGEGIYDPDFSPGNFTHPDMVTTQNPYWPLPAGRTVVVSSGDEEVVIIHVTDRVREVAGVPCRVVVDAAFEIDRGGEKNGAGVDYVIGEITDDWYAHHAITGDVWYCGERVRNFEDGILANQDGSFEAGVEGAKGGILVPFAPELSQAYRQEFAMDEAEDLAEVVSLATSPPDPDKGGSSFDCNGECVETYEFSPLEPDHAEFKYYLHGIGFVKALSLEDGEFDGGAEDLQCVGDSLDVLTDPGCGVENVEALLDALCSIDPDTFCAM